MRFSHILLILMIIVPILEIFLFMVVGEAIGIWLTLLLIVITAIIGSYLLRTQGTTIVYNLQTSLEQGIPPAISLLEGILLIFGGALLLTPGFFTDAVGFLCALPYSRFYLAHWLARHVFTGQNTVFKTTSFHYTDKHDSTTIEGHYRREDD